MSEPALTDEIIKHALDIERLAAGEKGRLKPLMDELANDLRGLLESGNLDAAGKREIAALIKQADEIIAGAYANASTLVEAAELAKVVAEKTRTILISALPAAAVRMPTAHVLTSLASDVLIQGSPAKAWWAKQSEDTAFRFSAQVRQGVANGETTAKIVQRIVGKRGEPGVIDISRRNAATLVQSSVQTVANDARLASFRANSDIIKGVRQVSTLDSHTSPICMAYSGAEWDLDGNPVNGAPPFNGGPPRHFNCLPGDALVSSRRDITGVSKRWFDGEVVVIKTASGCVLTATPNHPVLTDGGWVATGLINVGSNIIADALGERGSLIHGDGQDAPARIHDVAEAFLCARGVSAVPMEFSPEDFHGDGACGKVGVVWSDGFLGCVLDSPAAKHLGEVGLIGGGLAGLIGLSGGGHLTQFLHAFDTAASGLVSGGREGLTLMERRPIHSSELLLTPVSGGDSCLAENAQDDGRRGAERLGDPCSADTFAEQLYNLGGTDIFALGGAADPNFDTGTAQPSEHGGLSDSELAGQIIGGFSGPVFADKVVSVDREPFHDYVYNLETSGGWYIAQGLVVHNCRSTLVPVTRSFSELGIDRPDFKPTTRASKDGQIAADTTFEGFLDRQSKAFQDEMLGKGRADLWRSGAITLRDLVSGTGRPLSLDELRNRP